MGHMAADASTLKPQKWEERACAAKTYKIMWKVKIKSLYLNHMEKFYKKFVSEFILHNTPAESLKQLVNSLSEYFSALQKFVLVKALAISPPSWHLC